jgi:hypothetical protein
MKRGNAPAVSQARRYRVITNAMAVYHANTLLQDFDPQNFYISTLGVFLNYKM